MFALSAIPGTGGRDELATGGKDGKLGLVSPYFDGIVPAGLPSSTKDYLETLLDLLDCPIDSKAVTFVMRVDGDPMRDGNILDGDLLATRTGLRMTRTGEPSLQSDPRFHS